jgi:DNA repair protein RadC
MIKHMPQAGLLNGQADLPDQLQRGLPIYQVTLVQTGTLAAPEQAVTNAERAYRILAPWFKGADREQAVVLGLSQQLMPVGINLVSMGCLDRNIIHPREIYKALILMNAFAWVLAHNHPSSHPPAKLYPSREDHAVTRKLIASSNLLKIPLIDHLVIDPSGRYVSIFDRKRDMPAGGRQGALKKIRKSA